MYGWEKYQRCDRVIGCVSVQGSHPFKGSIWRANTLGHFKGSFKCDQEMRSSFPEFEGSNSSQPIPRFIASCMTFPNVTATAAKFLEATAGSPTGLAGGGEGRGFQLVEFWWIQPHLSMLLNPKHITFTKHMCFFLCPIGLQVSGSGEGMSG